MSARLIDGKALAERVRAAIKPQVDSLKARGVTPGLTVVIVGDDAASQVYVRNKLAACDAVGFVSSTHRLPAATSQAELHALIDTLNADPALHGILVQLPLPKHLDANAALARVAPAKDVDGFGAANLGLLAMGTPHCVPCTPLGCMRMLEDLGVDPAGKRAVVLGRSNIVGKPMAMLLTNANATVTLCHSRTVDLAAHTRQADILIAALGKPKFVTADMVKPGAIVIDVGINRTPEGKLCGDVDFAEVSEIAGEITPVPGGVGPMTVAMLLENTLKAARAATV